MKCKEFFWPICDGMLFFSVTFMLTKFKHIEKIKTEDDMHCE